MLKVTQIAGCFPSNATKGNYVHIEIMHDNAIVTIQESSPNTWNIEMDTPRESSDRLCILPCLKE